MQEEFNEGEFTLDNQGDFNEEIGEELVQEKTAQDLEKQRLARKEQKQQTLQRKLQKPNFDLIIEAKGIWEQLRQKRLTKPERKELMDKMMALVSGKALDIIYKHDASRIVQCCVKYGSPEQRDKVAEELSGHYAQLSQSKYGRFIVSKILQYCSPKYRQAVISDFHGKVRKLIRHKEASVVLDEAYSQFANASQRSSLMEEFYGPEFAVFKNTGNGPRSLHDLIEKEPMKKTYILKHLKSAIDSVLEKATFNVGKTPILHRAILDYLNIAESTSCKDMLELLKDHLVHMLHTREGAQITQYAILHSSPKDRKHIVKSFKGFVHAIAKEQYGHAALITCFECIDDTVLVGKALIGELFKPPTNESKVNELLRDQYGSRVILYLLMGRNKRYQPVYLITELEGTDEIRKETTKKEHESRHKQLLEVASPLLIEQVELFVNELIRDKQGSAVLLETIRNAIGDVQPIVDSVLSQAEASISTEGNLKVPDEPVHVVKKMKQEKDVEKLKSEGLDLSESVFLNRSSTMVLKSMLMKPKNQETSVPWKEDFSKRLWELIASKLHSFLEFCASNPRGTSGLAFILVALLENGSEDVVKSIKKSISKNDKKKYQKLLEKSSKNTPEAPMTDKKRKHDQTAKSGIEIFLDQL